MVADCLVEHRRLRGITWDGRRVFASSSSIRFRIALTCARCTHVACSRSALRFIIFKYRKKPRHFLLIREEREGLISCPERARDDLQALGDEDSGLRLIIMPQLRLAHRRIYLKFLRVRGIDLYFF